MWQHNKFTVSSTILNKKTVDPARCICFSLSQTRYWIWQINRFDVCSTLYAVSLVPSWFFFLSSNLLVSCTFFSHIPPLSYALDSTSPIYDILYMNVKEGGGKNWDLTDLGCTPPDKIKTPQWIRCSMLRCHCCFHRCWGFWRCIWNCLGEPINRVFGRQWEFAGHNLTQWGCAWVLDSEKFD